MNGNCHKCTVHYSGFCWFPTVFNSLILGKLQSESLSHICLFDHESTADKSNCYLVPTETWQMLIDVSGYKK